MLTKSQKKRRDLIFGAGASTRMITLSTIAHVLGGEVCGNQVRAPGPGHSPRDRSLSVRLEAGVPDGFLVYSFSGDDPMICKDYVRDKLSLPPRDRKTNSSGKAPTIATRYNYTDEAGKLLFQVVRYAPKGFRQRRPNGNGGWIWSLGDVRRVPYRLVGLMEAVAQGQPILIVEGEKDVESLRQLNVCATTNAGGAGKWRAEYAEHFRSADVVLCADNDDVGRQHMETVAASLAGLAARIRMLSLPNQLEKGDVSAWICIGGTAAGLHELIAAAPEWVHLHKTANRPWWHRELIKAQELCDQHFPDIKYAVQGLFPEGITLLASRPKLGKSWLLLQIGSAIASGTITLAASGTTPCPSDVLYLALEDNPRRLQRRMTKYFGDCRENWPLRLHFATKWERLNQGGLEALREWCESVEQPSLVMIDTLKKIRPPKRSGQTDYDADYEACQGLQELAGEFGMAVFVAHHDRKMDAEDVFDTVSGTLGLIGGVDTVAILKRKASAITLHIEGRDLVETIEKAMTFDRETCRWAILGDAVEVQRSSERARVLSVLKGALNGLYVSEIVARTSLTSRGAADKLLGRMLEDGDVERLKRGLYALPGAAPMSQEEMREKVRSQRIPLKEQEDKMQSPNLPHLPHADGTDGSLSIDATHKTSWPDLPDFLDRRNKREGRAAAPGHR